jgi:hypothetical protein
MLVIPVMGEAAPLLGIILASVEVTALAGLRKAGMGVGVGTAGMGVQGVTAATAAVLLLGLKPMPPCLL